MRNITLVFSLFAIMFAFVGTTDAQVQMEEYCNARFSFCIEYPAHIFTEKHESTNGDGIELINDAGDAYIVASGTNNTLNTSVEAEYKNFLNFIIESEGVIKEIDSHRDENHLKVTVEVGNKYFFYQAFIADNFIVASMVRSDMDDPKASLAAFNYLKEAVQLEVDFTNGNAIGFTGKK